MSEPADIVGPRTGRRSLFYGSVPIVLVILFWAALSPVSIGIAKTKENWAMQQTRSINLLLFSYACDNNQVYPDGKSSTEIFQKLIDDNYCNDPTIFYIPLPGKTKPVPGQKLKPENVCFDVTGGVDAGCSDLLPIVFMTGYRVNYVPDGSAVPIIQPYPQFGDVPRTWSDWWHGGSIRESLGPGIAVAYKSNSAAFRKLMEVGSEGMVAPHFIAITFKAEGRTYRQLTPEGELMP